MKRYSTIKEHNLIQLLLTILFSLAAFAHSNAQTLLYDFKFNNNLTDDVHGATFNSTLVANSTKYGFTTAIPYSGGTWKHVAVSFDGATLRIYLNGTQVYSVAKTLNITGTTFQIGVAVDDYQLGMLATIDDLKIYSGALTPAEILPLTQQPGNPNIANLSEQNITPYSADIHFDL